MRWRRLAAALLPLAAVVPASAQQSLRGAPARPGWLPRTGRIGGELATAQRATANSRLEQLERILLQVPELAEPRGFEIVPQFFGGSRELGPDQTPKPGNVVEYMVTLMFYLQTKAVAGEGGPCVTITVNAGARHGLRDEQGRSIYIEQPRGKALPLATQVYDGLSETPERSMVTVLLTSGGEIPWRHVTREEYYKAVILERDGKNGSKIAKAQKAMAKTPYQEWMEGAAERTKMREVSLRSAAAVGRSVEELAKMRKQLEDTEKQVTDRFKASEADDRTRQQQALAALAENPVRAELEAMSAAERSMPALINSTLSEGPNATGWRMTARDELPATWRVLTPNYDFWRARRSPVEVRSLTVHLLTTGTCLSPAVHNAVMETWKKLDWSALNRMLDVPR